MSHQTKICSRIGLLSAGCLVVAVGTIALVVSTTPANAVCEEHKKNTAAYKRCLSYLYMAGTPSQRQDAADQMKQNRARKRCSWYPRESAKNRVWVCDDYQTRRDKAREDAMKRANRGEDGPTLNPIVNPNSGAFGDPKPKPAAPACPPNHVLNRSGACVATIRCGPGQAVSPMTGQCGPGCRPSYVLSPVNGRCVPGCRPGNVMTRTGGCVPA